MLIGLLLFDALVLVGGKVHSMVPGEAAREATIVIENGRITLVGDPSSTPADARRIDVHGLHVIPGLIDGFAYHDPEHDWLYTAAGVTLIRDHGNDLGRIFENRDPQRRDAALGPTLSISGAVFDGVPPATSAALPVRSAAEAQAQLELLAAEHIDFIAFQSNVPVEAWKALCTAGAAKKLQVWGPLPKTVSLADALKAGQSGFTFCDCLLPSGKTWESVEIAQCEPLAQLFAKSGARLTPVLRGQARLGEDPGDNAPELEHLGPQYSNLWSIELTQRRKLLDETSRHRIDVLLGKERALLVALFRAGAVLVPGSGAPQPWLLPGDGLHRELREWQNDGIPAADVVRLATAGAAKALGLDGERGTIAPGQIADLVLTRDDPTLDVAALDTIETVVLRGVALTRGQIDSKLAELVGVQNAARAAARAPIDVEAPELPEGSQLLSGRTETTSALGPLAAERWAIVREVDGTLTFCGRRKTRGSATVAERVIEVRQRVRDGKFDSFSVRVRSQEHEMVVRGQFVAGQLRVERRTDGTFIDNRAAAEPVVAIDVGSVTTMMLLAHTRAAGQMPILRFDEGLELEVVRWDLALDEVAGHYFRTPQGLRFASFYEDGSLKAVAEQQGAGMLQTNSMEIDVHGGPGLPLPPDKLALVRKAAKPAEAATPTKQ
jgi:hypothetical protein